ncbi:MAG: hypothetical protein AB8I08_37750 [Sandaracinaceae bacterium]
MPFCCAGGGCAREFCLAGVPRGPCTDSGECGEGLCTHDECGWAACVPDCRASGDCALRGLVCVGEFCTFDCHLDGFAGCGDGTACRENGRCGVPRCDDTGCGRQEECGPPLTGPMGHRFSGCRPLGCASSRDCPDDGFCVDGGCSEQPGQCTRIPDGPPAAHGPPIAQP